MGDDFYMDAPFIYGGDKPLIDVAGKPVGTVELPKLELPPNPKDIIGKTKIPLRLLPPVAKVHWAMAQNDGAIKYGPFNWRKFPIEMVGYIEAGMRHFDCLLDGEWLAEDSGVTHLGHIMATASIILDAHHFGTLIDNRPVPGRTAAVHREFIRTGPSSVYNRVGSALRTDWADWEAELKKRGLL